MVVNSRFPCIDALGMGCEGLDLWIVVFKFGGVFNGEVSFIDDNWWEFSVDV